ncbi:cytochrome c oxidase cbb3-type subunit 3 [Thiogranum longum]|uniref:Cbb3-type cytochrome c oxidase subunit n=1 Tax=Thiogranum longum TaxID=1537524 RepID=A0A4R1H5T4_9GAMM|nr:cytochrome-c oxidase, cbb3-type subunit III [Thiogranum longum]TCK17087.1 cytochrome c oxidase cbb3-type subunit 3 [Thiogranum longum]
MSDTKKPQSAVQTTGHAWDGDIQEFNNPLPNWWLWAFYATVVFAVVYWIFYPAWPVGSSYTTGVMNNITFVDSDGTEKTMHWNTRALLLKDLQEGKSATLSREYLEKVQGADYETILGDAEMMAFTRSMAVGLFGDNCMPCHGAGGGGVMGLFPNLADDDWLWGGTVEDIQTTISDGRYGFMPSFRETFNDQQLDDVAAYVLSLSGQETDSASAQRGKRLFQTSAGGCYYCHGTDGKGMKSQGSANLTDQIWTIADVPGADAPAQKRAAVKAVVANGVQRTMPHWSDRLDKTQIKLLTVYVHELGGGQ